MLAKVVATELTPIVFNSRREIAAILRARSKSNFLGLPKPTSNTRLNGDFGDV